MTTQITLAETSELLTGAVNWFLVTSLRNRFRPRYFVETGTGGGQTARNAAVMFEHVWSIEVDPERLGWARSHCEGIGNITLLLGDSTNVLPSVCADLGDDTALFYLDAHWCGGERVGPVECPLLDELRCVCQRSRDVIIIDNAGMLLNPPVKPHRPEEWPTMQEVIEVIVDRYPQATMQLLFDQIVITPEPLLGVLKKGKQYP
jgi:hypothetical protein